MSQARYLGNGFASASVADTAALTAGASSADNPTDDEYNELLADVTALRTKVNELLAALRAGGVIGS